MNDSPINFLGKIGGALKGIASKAKAFGDKAKANSFSAKHGLDTQAGMQQDALQNKAQGNKKKMSNNPYGGGIMRMASGGGFNTTNPSPDRTDMSSNASAMYRKKHGY